jgi:hypothetical protein
MDFWFYYDNSASTYDGRFTTNTKFRDVAAWMHVVFAWDTTQATNTNRLKLYINGVNQKDAGGYSTETYPDQNQTVTWGGTSAAHRIGANPETANNKWNGYMAEVVYCDGTQYAASDFGEFDSDSPTIWKPKDVSGLTFGTNGFYLDFEDSSDLGNDVSGNNNDFTATGIAAVDQATDTPTNNFATLNSVEPPATSRTYSEGNLQVVFPDGNICTSISTIGMSKGKWYFEAKVTAGSSGNPRGLVGICYNPYSIDSNGEYMGSTQDPGSIAYYAQNGDVYKASSSVYSGSDFDTGDTISCALDLDNQEVYFAKNGTWQNSGDPTSGATGTGGVDTDDPADRSGFYFFGVGDPSGVYGQTFSVNFGSPAHSISSGNADANGYGNFEYAVPSGYLALCTKNLGSDGG